MSRADLARRSGLTEGTVSRITSGLIERGFIREHGADDSTGGRPGTRLRLDDTQVGIGVEILREGVRMAAVTLSGNVVDSISFDTPSAPLETLKAVATHFQHFRTAFGRSRIAGVGVSVHGIVNSETGLVESGMATSWNGIAVRGTLQELLDSPVEIDNNVRLAAIAEYHYGNLLEVRNSRSLLFAVIDEGFGIGIVLDGQLYRGPGHAAGECGQMIIADTGGPAQLDNAGCLEQLASSTALCDRFAVLSKRGFSGGTDSRSRVRKICQLALAGDESAVKAVAQTCRYVGIGIANILWSLNSDAVVIDSAMNEAWPLVAAAIRDQFPKNQEVVNFRHLVLRPSSLGGQATILGAATMPFQSAFTSGELTQAGRLSKTAR